MKNKKVLYVLTIFFIVMIIISGTKVINYLKDNNQNKKINKIISKEIKVIDDSTNEEENEYVINFQKLKKINNDTIGFIKINGTNIEHIVVKTNNNTYYLNHNFQKEENVAGWIFMDYRNNIESDKNIIIYGHNMKNNSMFGTLKNVLTNDWYNNEENRYINFITETYSYTYKVFSVYQIETEDYYTKINFTNDEYREYLKTMKSRSIYNFDVELDADSKILTLSTCGSNSNYRIVLHAVKINS